MNFFARPKTKPQTRDQLTAFSASRTRDPRACTTTPYYMQEENKNKNPPRHSRVAGRAYSGGRGSLLGLLLLHVEDARLDGVLEDELRNLNRKSNTHAHALNRLLRRSHRRRELHPTQPWANNKRNPITVSGSRTTCTTLLLSVKQSDHMTQQISFGTLY